MCWAFSLWDGEIKFDLHPNLWLCYQKQQHVSHLSHQLAVTESKWYQLKKLLKIKTIVTADKINNYFCLEVTNIYGNLLRHYSNFPLKHQYHQYQQKKVILISAELHEELKKTIYSNVFLPYIPLYSYCLFHNISIIYAFKPS